MGSGVGRKLNEAVTSNKSALARLEQIEGQLQQIVGALNQSLTIVDKCLGSLEETVEAIASCVGVEQIKKAIADNRAAQQAAQAEAEKASLADAVKDGRAVATNAIEENTLIVGCEYKPDGSVLGAGRVQVFFSQLSSDIVEQLSGKGAGHTIDLPAGGKFEVQEVYRLVKKDPTPETATPDELVNELAAVDAGQPS